MAFNADKPIFLQMADRLCDDDRIPSVREYAVLLEVNTNTAMKAYDQLAREHIIYNKRGLGYYVTPGAREQILTQRRRDFMQLQLPELFRQMRLLGLDIKQVADAWEEES